MNPKGTPNDDPTNKVTRMKRESQDDLQLDPLETKDEIVRSGCVRPATPTTETYEALQTAYDFFNGALFGGQLPSCLITLQRRDMRTYGYYSPQRFAEIGGERFTDEIAINPQHFTNGTVESVLSTLVHEKCHLWQFRFGRPSRNGYHNKEWGAKMRDAGLCPSNTGAVGGRETGQQMDHYVIKGGAFDKACQILLGTKFALKWGEFIDDFSNAGEDGDNDGSGIHGERDTIKKNKSNRVKYCCPCCDTAVWGKPNLNIICGDCGMPLAAEE